MQNPILQNKQNEREVEYPIYICKCGSKRAKITKEGTICVNCSTPVSEWKEDNAK